MTYLSPANFRSNSLHEACTGLDLTDDDATDATLSAVIARLSGRLDRWANDTFETATGAAFVNGEGGDRLMLPARYTAVSEVKTVDAYGALSSAADVASYRLRSSLNAAGSLRIENAMLDWLELAGGYSLPNGSYEWPEGVASVKVTGTYGWSVTPPEIKRALALLVWDHLKRQRSDLRVAESVTANNVIVRYSPPDPANGIFTGINEADEIIADYRRVPTAMVR